MIIDGIHLTADEGKSLFCNFNKINYGTDVWLGKVYYDSEGAPLPQPHLLTVEDFTEIDIEPDE